MNLDSLDPEVRAKAFYLQDKIAREGIQAVGFMKVARRHAKRNASRIVAENIRGKL